MNFRLLSFTFTTGVLEQCHMEAVSERRALEKLLTLAAWRAAASMDSSTRTYTDKTHAQIHGQIACNPGTEMPKNRDVNRAAPLTHVAGTKKLSCLLPVDISLPISLDVLFCLCYLTISERSYSENSRCGS